MNLVSKLGLILASSSLLTGCQSTPTSQSTNNQSTPTSLPKGYVRFIPSNQSSQTQPLDPVQRFTPALLGLNANQQRFNGNLQNAANLDVLAASTQNEINNQVQMQAAEASRSQVNVNIQSPNEVGMYLGNYVDFNANRRLEDNELLHPRYEGTFRKNSIIMFYANIKYGNRLYNIKIKK